MSDTYTDCADPLTIYNAETGEERSCSQAEFDETFEPAGWEIIEPIGDPAVLITVTNPETGETKTITGAEFIEQQPKGVRRVDKPRGAGRLTEKQRARLRTEEDQKRGRDEGRDEERR